MKFDRKSLLKLSAVVEKLHKEYGNGDGDKETRQKNLLKTICKIHWLFDQGCEIVEDWIMAQSDLTNKVAVPWNLSVHPESVNRIIPGENYKSGTSYFIIFPEKLAEKILLFGIPETEIEKNSDAIGIIDWIMGKKTFDQLQNEMNKVPILTT